MKTTTLDHAIRNRTFKENDLNDDSELHPDCTISEASPTRDPIEAVEIFKERLTTVYEGDAGDWKRDMNAGLHQLKQSLIGQEYWVQRTVDHMRELVSGQQREDITVMHAELRKRAEGIVKGLKKESYRERVGNKVG